MATSGAQPYCSRGASRSPSRIGAQRRTAIGTPWATVEINNGVKLTRRCSTPAPRVRPSSLDAAKRLSVNPDKDGFALLEGFSWGAGQKRVRTSEVAHFGKINIIGGEVRSASPGCRFSTGALGDADMLIGVDFFLSHRVPVDNQNHWISHLRRRDLFGISPKGRG
ncbi:hypothetical protein ACRAWD_05970 [Caulobacter segnis]